MTERPLRRRDVLERKVGSEQMLYDPAGRQIHVLNETAKFLWDRCDGTRSIDDLVAEAAATFQAEPDAVRADVGECLARLRELALLEG